MVVFEAMIVACTLVVLCIYEVYMYNEVFCSLSNSYFRLAGELLRSGNGVSSSYHDISGACHALLSGLINIPL